MSSPYQRAIERLQDAEEKQHKDDAQNRLLGLPHKADPLAAHNSTRGDEAFSLTSRATFVEDTDGKPFMRALPLDDAGKPRMSPQLETRLARAYETTRPRDWLTITEVCELTGLSRDIIWSACVNKAIKGAFRTIGPSRGSYRIPMRSFGPWLQETGRSDEDVRELVGEAETVLEERQARGA